MTYLIAVDVGGTCTDCAVVDSTGEVSLAKTFSTPPSFAEGIVAVLEQVAERFGSSVRDLIAETSLFLHSTTVAENAVVDGTLATSGLIMTHGFEQTLVSMRGGYGRWSGLSEIEKRDPINTDKPLPLVPLRLTRSVRERVDATGEQLRAPDRGEVRRAIQELLDEGIESLAVACLWSFLEPAAEELVKDVALDLRPDLFVSCSSKIAPVIGEYERASTTALNARLGPIVAAYLEDLAARLGELDFDGALLIMQASGGLVPVQEAKTRPVGLIESGPIGGLVGARHIGELLGINNIIAADMGGTTFKVGVIRNGSVEYQRESLVFRYHYALPKIDITSLGIAGGSIVSVDPRTGYPRIGPRSAGSYPGPVCYGHGGKEPTITDVDAILGYLNPDFFLGGEVPLQISAATSAFESAVAEPLGLSVEDAAAGMYRLGNSMMYDLLHKTTVERGLDPRGYVLVSFGGTAAMHACAYAAQLGVERVVIPYSASVQGAFGLLTADIVHEAQVTRPARMPVPVLDLADIYGALEQEVREQLEQEGFGSGNSSFARLVDMRYLRQTHILTVPFPSGSITDATLVYLLAEFDRLYQQRYGEDSGYLDAGVELVGYRVRGTGLVRKPRFEEFEAGPSDASAALVGERRAWVEEGEVFQTVPGYSFELMNPGCSIDGPAIIWTPITTVVLGTHNRATVDGYRNLIIDFDRAEAGTRLTKAVPELRPVQA